MQASRYAQAIALLDQVVQKKPAFAEGWNRRATVYYLAGRVCASRSPTATRCSSATRGHFGALSGLGQIYLQLEDGPNALKWFRRALEVNPNMLGVEMNVRMLEEKLKAPSSTWAIDVAASRGSLEGEQVPAGHLAQP